MSETAKIVIATLDPEVAKLAEALRAEGIDSQVAGSFREVEPFVEPVRRCLAVVDCELPETEVFRIYKLLHGSRSIPTLMLVPAGSYHRFALDPHRPTPDDYVAKPVSAGELALRVKAMMLRAGYELPSLAPAPAPPAAERPPEMEGLRRGQVVALFSVKGGVGKSTIAVNLAIGLVQFYGCKTILVDANLWFGDVGILLNAEWSKSLFDLCAGADPDIPTLQQSVYQHPSGLSVLLRPKDLVAVEKMEVGSIIKALGICRALFDYVVVDTQPSLDELNLQVLEVADQILLVTTPEVSATANVSRFLNIAEPLGYLPKISLVVNRSNFGIDVDSLQQSLRVPVAARVVSAGHAVVQAANQGASLFSKDPGRSQQVTQDMAQIVDLVAGPIPSGARGDQKKRRALFGGRAR